MVTQNVNWVDGRNPGISFFQRISNERIFFPPKKIFSTKIQFFVSFRRISSPLFSKNRIYDKLIGLLTNRLIRCRFGFRHEPEIPTLVVIVPSPSLSKSSKASLNSATCSSVKSSTADMMTLMLLLMTVAQKFAAQNFAKKINPSKEEETRSPLSVRSMLHISGDNSKAFFSILKS